LNLLYEGFYEDEVSKKIHIKFDDKKHVYNESVLLHQKHTGVIEIKNKVPIKDRFLFNVVYSPKNASESCNLIYNNKDTIFDYTCKSNLVAIVSDGSAVLGLGNIGAEAAMPVMEGKALLFKTFGGVEAFPICLSTQEPEEIIKIVEKISVVFGGINLEDISAPRCFYVEEELKKRLDIPVFHDDQHGTAVIVLAALKNALKIVNKKIEDIKIVVNGAGAGATAVSKLILRGGAKNLIMCDTKGAIYKGRNIGMNEMKNKMASITNPHKEKGTIKEVLKGADVFIGLSKGNLLTSKDIKIMSENSIIFALANPTPEIMPDEAKKGGARIVATGRSDFPNQVNNCLAFPGIFRGALDVRAKKITDEMKIAASDAIASLALENLSEEHIIPDGLDLRVPIKVAKAVAKKAMETNIAKTKINIENIEVKLHEFLYEKGLLE
jgi:malate dehydrogenase (oxaloacetate-decarboxylating)